MDELRAAAKLEPRNAGVQSDLAVAFLQRAELEQDPVAILEAYTANDSALALDPELTEALFNRALILDHLYLRELAVEQFKTYLKLDGSSPWADEARDRLRDLEQPAPTWSKARETLNRAAAKGDTDVVSGIVNQFPSHARDELRAALVDWGQAVADGDARAPASLRRAFMLADLLRLHTDDAMWTRVVEHINATQSAGDYRRLRKIADGFVGYGHGLLHLERLAPDSANVPLEHALGLFSAAGSPMSHQVMFDLGRVSYQRHDSAAYADARARFQNVLANAAPDYRWVRALARRTIGFIEFIGANFDIASGELSTAIAEGVSVRDPVLELRTRSDVARLVATLRGENAGWRELYRAFRALPGYPDATSDAQRPFSAAAVLSWRRFPSVASLFQHEFVRLTALTGDSTSMVSALTREAELLVREGRPAQAQESLRRISQYTPGISDDRIRSLMMADADLVRGQTLLKEQPDVAVRALRDVVERYDVTNYLVQASRAKLALANAFVAIGSMDSARLVFDEAVSIIASARAGIASYDDRARFLDQARPIIDRVVAFYLSRPDTTGALDFIERMRARVLLERAGRVAPNADAVYRSVDVIRRALDPQTSIVSFAVLDDTLIGWLIRRDGIWMHRVPNTDRLQVVAAELTRLITTRATGPEVIAASDRLRESLITSFESRIPDGSKLIIVPDKWLHFVPFSALFNARKGQFLIQSYELAVAPSVRLFADAMARSASLGTMSRSSVLAVGNPAFDHGVYSLPDLPGAEEEARELSQLYPDTRLLLGAEAKRSEFLKQATSATVIHFAGHGMISTDAPLLSQLVLAPDNGAGASGAIYAKDLFEMTLPVTRLAILSGCRTADGALSGTEGASSLARALFAAGVPAVIAGLWPVEDAGTQRFFAAFHADLSRSRDPAAALRRTQVQWIEQGDPWKTANTWAAFQLFGAAAGPHLGRAALENRLLQPSNRTLTTESGRAGRHRAGPMR